MKAKRLISCVSALAISSVACFSGFVNAATSDVVLKGEHIECEAGSEFNLNINLSQLNGDAAKGFAGCEFAIKYDPSKITINKLTEGDTLTSTKATEAELKKSSKIGEEVEMINKNSSYNCFDYNKLDKDGIVTVLWCTGLESKENWASKAGTILTVNGTVAKEATGDIPVEVVAINRDGNDQIIFGCLENDKDKTFTVEVAEQGLISVKDGKTDKVEVTLWGDLNNDGVVSAADLVACVQCNLDFELANLDEQGIANGNLVQDGKEVSEDEIINEDDLYILKKLVLGDVDSTQLPIKDLKNFK